jgi:WD40 repeat protein
MNRVDRLISVLVLIVFLSLPSGAVAAPVNGDVIPPVPVWSDQVLPSDYNQGVMVSISGDGRTIAAGTNTGIIRIYDNRGNTLMTYRDPDGHAKITDLALSRNGEFAGAVLDHHYEGEILYFDTEGNRVWKTPSENNARIALSGDGRTMIAGRVHSFYLFDSTMGLVKEIPCNASVDAVAVSDDGRYIATGTWFDAWVQTFDSNGTLLWSTKTYGTHEPYGAISGLQISHNGDTTVAENTGRVYFLSSTGEPVALFLHDADMSRDAIKISDTGEFAVVYSNAKIFYITRTGKKIWDHTVSNVADIRRTYNTDGFSLSGDGAFVSAVGDSAVLVWDNNGQLLWQYHLSSPGTSIASSRNGKHIAVGTTNRIYFFNTNGTSAMPESESTPIPVPPPPTSLSTATPKAAFPVFMVMLALGIIVIIWGSRGND